ncbi:hypothetical protein [Natronorarus salvus]
MTTLPTDASATSGGPNGRIRWPKTPPWGSTGDVDRPSHLFALLR